MIHLVYGNPQVGKSVLMHDLVRVQARSQRFFVQDHDWSWGPDDPRWRGKPPPGLLTLHRDLPADLPETGVFAFRGVGGRAVAEHAKRLGCAVYVDDEIDKAGAKEGFVGSALRDIVNEGSHILSPDESSVHSVHILGACRRPQQLHTDLSCMAERVYIFRINGDLTIERMIRDSHITRDEAEQVQTQPKFAFKVWHNGESEWRSIPPLT